MQVCQTVYESECWTEQEQHRVEDDVPVCQAVEEEECGVDGKCRAVSRQRCTVQRKQVTKDCLTPGSNCGRPGWLVW